MRILLHLIIISFFILPIISCEKPKEIAKDYSLNKLTSLTNFVGAKKEIIINILGKPDSDSKSNFLKWKKFHIQCYFRNNYISSISFRKGFKGKISNINIGATMDDLLSICGRPDLITNQNHKIIYFYQGLLFWLNDRKEVDNIIYSKRNFKLEDKTWNELLNITNYLGQSKEKIFGFLGQPDRTANPKWYFWDKYCISCLFHNDSMFEIRFSHWFKGKLNSNIGFGSSEKDVLKIYGKPNLISNNPKRFRYEQPNLNAMFTFKFNRVSEFSIYK